MLDSILLNSGTSLPAVLACMAVSLILGIIIALCYMFRGSYNKSFVVTLALLPVIVQSVILVVNGNLGTGVAVMGAFSLVRFRSVPGGAKEIAAVFFAMAAGLAAGMGYIAYAALFTAVVGAAMVVYNISSFGNSKTTTKQLRVVIPEDIDYSGIFDDIFSEYASKATLERVKTTNLGSLFELSYNIELKPNANEKAMLDNIRLRNGNLNISLGYLTNQKDDLL